MDTARFLLDYARKMRDTGSPNALEIFGEAQDAASKVHNWRVLYHAYAGVGKMHLDCDDAEKAMPWYEEAHRIARLGDLTFWLAPAAHDLYVCCAITGEESKEHEYKRKAVEGYAFSHPRSFALIHDMASIGLWRGESLKAFGVLESPIACEELWPCHSSDVLIPYGNLLLAAGKAGMDECFFHWLQDFRAARARFGDSGAAVALYHAGLGAKALDSHGEARNLLVAAKELATRRGERKISFAAGQELAHLAG